MHSSPLTDSLRSSSSPIFPTTSFSPIHEAPVLVVFRCHGKGETRSLGQMKMRGREWEWEREREREQTPRHPLLCKQMNCVQLLSIFCMKILSVHLLSIFSPIYGHVWTRCYFYFTSLLSLRSALGEVHPSALRQQLRASERQIGETGEGKEGKRRLFKSSFASALLSASWVTNTSRPCPLLLWRSASHFLGVGNRCAPFTNTPPI